MRHDPVRVLALAILRQAVIDYCRERGVLRRDAAVFLNGEGRKLWLTLGLDVEQLEHILENPQVYGKRFVAFRRRKR